METTFEITLVVKINDGIEPSLVRSNIHNAIREEVIRPYNHARMVSLSTHEV